MRIIIAGGRDFNNYESLRQHCTDIIVSMRCQGVCNDINNIEIVCGKARGADTLGEQYGKSYGYKIT